MDVWARRTKFEVRSSKTANRQGAKTDAIRANRFLLLLALGGCAELRPGLGPTTEAPGSSLTPNTASAPIPAAPEPAEESTLAAVEEFLDRTKEFRVDGGATAAVGATKPAESDGVVTTTNEPSRSKPSPDQAFANTQVTIADAAPARPTLAIPAVQSVTVRADPSPPRDPTPPITHAANASMDARGDDLHEAADRLLRSLESDAAVKRDFESEWTLRLTQLAMGRQTDPPTVSADVAEPSRGLLIAFLETAPRIQRTGRDPRGAPQEAVAAVSKLRDRLLEQSDPTIGAVALCRKVVTFGVYDEMSADEFVAGRSIQTIVYSELENLRPLKGEDGMFETRLATRLELFSAKGDSVWQRDEPEVIDRCRRRRSDFFLAQRITLPPTLGEGEYTLKVSIEDRLAARADERTIPIAVKSPVSLANKKTVTGP